MRIALVTCERPIERDDDLDFLAPALRRRQVEVETPGWSDPKVEWGSYDLAMLSSTWDYHEKQDQFRAWLRSTAKVTRLVNPLKLVEWNLDKRYLRELDAAAVPTIPTVWSEPGQTAQTTEEVARLSWTDVIIKPVIDLGARNLVKVKAEVVETMLGQYDVPTMLQPYLSSVASAGELSLVYVEGELSHALRKLPARGDFRVQPQYGGTHEAVSAPPRAIEIGDAALAAAPSPALYARVDLVETDDGGLALIELELIEPALYLDCAPSTAGAGALAKALVSAAA
jgi:glutathione synthase/RimK-type ligase-like ATP-grasp enzyme